MKQAMLTAMGVVLVVAGLSGAYSFVSMPEPPKRVTQLQASPLPQAQPVATKPPAAPAAAPSAMPSAPSGVTKISTAPQPELQRPPVPYLHAARPPVPVKEEASADKSDKTADKTTEKPADTATAPSTAPMPAAEDQEGARLARSAIERDGYRKVKVVSKSADGSWRGRAMRGSTEVGVTVDAEGNVRVD